MPINAKLTYIFNAERWGWSETWYMRNVASNEAAMQLAKDLAPFRVGLLAPGANLEAIRVSDDVIRGDSILETYEKTAKGGASGGDERTDLPMVAWLCRASSGDTYRRSMWLRGASDEWTVYNPQDGTFDLQPKMKEQLAKFLDQAKKSRLSIKAISKAALTNPSKPVTNFVSITDTKLKIKIPGHGLTATSRVSFSGIQGDANAKKINGNHPVEVVDADNVNLLTPIFGSVPLYYGGGTMKTRNQDYFAIDGLIPLRAGKRDTGRRFFVTRGRRAAKRAA